MRIAATKELAHQRLDMTTPDESRQEPVNQESATALAPGRALVPCPPPAAPASISNYRQATFLAQLIATRDHAPQTRDRRRAEPAVAIAAYRAVAALAGA